MESRDRHSLLSRYFSEIRGYPLLSKDQEHVLAREVQNKGCQNSLNGLIESNLSFVVKVASEYRNLGLPFEDLLNEGNLGLIEAARRYDASKGTKFITYAIWWIRKSILKALSEHSSLVRVPTYQMKKVREIRDVEATLSRHLGRRPRRDEISKRLDRSLSKVDQILQFNLREMSLDDKFGKDRDKPVSDFLVDARSVNPEDDLIKREAITLVAEALGFSLSIPLIVFATLANAILTLLPLGGLGVAEFGVAELLTRSLTRSAAGSVVILDRAISYVSVIILGGIFFLIRNIVMKKRAGRGTVILD